MCKAAGILNTPLTPYLDRDYVRVPKPKQRTRGAFKCPSCGLSLQAVLKHELTTVQCECSRSFCVRLPPKKGGGGRFYKSKGRVEKVLERYVAVLSMLDGSGVHIQLDQEDLETVLPGDPYGWGSTTLRTAVAASDIMASDGLV